MLIEIKFLVVHQYGWDFFEINAILGALISSIVFIYGFMLTGTIKEYRDSIDIPYQIRMYLDSMLRDGMLLKRTSPEFNLEKLKTIILAFTKRYIEEILSKKPQMDCLHHLYELDDLFVDMTKMGVPSGYIVAAKNKRFEVKRLVIKGFEIKKQPYMPLISNLQYIITGMLMIIIVFLKVGNHLEDAMISVAFMYMFVYLLHTLHIMDNPFSDENFDIKENMNNLVEFRNKISTAYEVK